MPTCRVCESDLPTVRMPNSLGQAMWGGWDCPSCGAALDAKGRPLAARTEHADRVVFRSGRPPSGWFGMGMLVGLVSMIGCMGASPMVVGTLVAAVQSPWSVLLSVLVVGGAIVGFFGYAIGMTGVSVWLTRRGTVVEVLATRLVVDDEVVLYTDVEEVVGEGPSARIRRRSGAPIPIGHVAGLQDAVRSAVERFQAEQDGAEAATADERARLQGLSRTST